MNIADYLTADEIAHFTATSDAQGWRLVLGNWLFIAVILAVAGNYPNPVLVLVAMVLLAGRQLGLSVLMHEASMRLWR